MRPNPRRAALGPPLTLVAACVALAGCGSGGSSHQPDLAQLPLVDGASVVTQVRACDHGHNAFCAIEIVVTDHRYKTSSDLVEDEHAQLDKHGWTGGQGDTNQQKAADSPGHKLRVTYATASGDLRGIDLGSIQRPRKITLALSHVMFDQAPAMSIMLEVGAS
ncbi:MAG TPA: hypothetical protein VGF93_00640 [Solirubrobacteraceae bacterium]